MKCDERQPLAITARVGIPVAVGAVFRRAWREGGDKRDGRECYADDSRDDTRPDVSQSDSDARHQETAETDASECTRYATVSPRTSRSNRYPVLLPLLRMVRLPFSAASAVTR